MSIDTAMARIAALQSFMAPPPPVQHTAPPVQGASFAPASAR